MYRAGEHDAEVLLGATPAEHPHRIDAAPPRGEALSHRVTGVNGGAESEGCEPVSVVAVPYAPPLALPLASVGALAGLLALRPP